MISFYDPTIANQRINKAFFYGCQSLSDFGCDVLKIKRRCDTIIWKVLVGMSFMQKYVIEV